MKLAMTSTITALMLTATGLTANAQFYGRLAGKIRNQIQDATPIVKDVRCTPICVRRRNGKCVFECR